MASDPETDGEGLGFFEDVFGDLPRPMLLNAPLFPSISWASSTTIATATLAPTALTAKEGKFLKRAEDLLLLIAPYASLAEDKASLNNIKKYLSEKQQGVRSSYPRSLKEMKNDLARIFHALEAAKKAAS